MTTQRGGARAGAGRKKGSATKRTREIADKHLDTPGAVSPLEVLLAIMTDAAKRDKAGVMADKDLAMESAKAAAPYVHPKLAAIEHSGKDGGPFAIVISPDDAAL